MRRKQYRPSRSLDQPYMFPPRADEWLPEDHLAFFILEVLDQLDIHVIEDVIQDKDPRGERPYDPRLMLRILIYGYCCGIYSSRRLERATREDVAFRVIAGDCHPHFTTINEFRRVHRTAFATLFLGVLKLCQAAGLVKLGHVALDGTKIKADASKHKANSYERLTDKEKKLMAEIEAMLDRSVETDAEEDERYGAGEREFELPAELKMREGRLEKLRAAKKAMEAEAKQVRAEELRKRAEEQRGKAEVEDDPSEKKRRLTRGDKSEAKADELDPPDDDEPPAASAPTDLPEHRIQTTPDGEPKPKAQHNYTDPDSCIMKGRDGGFIQAYNAQAGVDDEHHVIVATGITNQAPDSGHFAPMLARVSDNCGETPAIVTADSGYWAPEAMAAADEAGINALIAVVRTKKQERRAPTGIGPSSGPLEPKEAMRHRLDMQPNRDVYKKRKATVEPVFGNIKEARGFRQFSFRGLEAVTAEWDLVCLCHNVLKLFHSGWRPTRA